MDNPNAPRKIDRMSGITHVPLCLEKTGSVGLNKIQFDHVIMVKQKMTGLGHVHYGEGS